MLRRSLVRCANKFEEQYASTGSSVKGGQGRSKTSLQVSLIGSRSGALAEVLAPFAQHQVNLRNVTNRRQSYESKSKYQTMYLDVDAHMEDEVMKNQIMPALNHLSHAVNVIGSWKIPWYPTEPQHLDLLDQNTLSAGEDLVDDPENPHPGFHDEEYKARRKLIAQSAKAFRHGDKIPFMDYTAQEKATWTAVWDKLLKLFPSHACKQFNNALPLFLENAGFCRTELPQLQTVSEFLKDATGFTVRPVAGLLSSRDFFNALAFRIFFSTQYIRHHSQPLYTPEPDLVHEIVGHVPMLADPQYADFCQTIGFASLGASDEMIEELGRCFWYSVEFGLCKQPGGIRAYGAGLLSSAGELDYSLSSKPQHLPWDPFVAAKMPFPITKYQPVYFVAEDFKDAQVKLEKWIDAQDRPFTVEYNHHSGKVETFPKTAVSLLVDL